jgi:hypothetical protein
MCAAACLKICVRIICMILWGEIRQFPLFAVLQFLSGQRRTGVLDIQDFEEIGIIHMSRGRIDAICSPLWDEAVGARLVKAKALTEDQMKECLLEGGEGDDASLALALLLERSQGDLRHLREIIDNHVGDVVMQLMFWNAGTFRFTVPAKPVEFTVLPFRDVENLLLDAIRRVDEGERPWRDKVLTEEEFCVTCTMDCSDEIKDRYLRSDVCLWRSMPSTLKDPIYRGIRKKPSPYEYDMDDYYEELPFI